MFTRPSMYARHCLVIAALGLVLLEPFPALVGSAAPSPSYPTAPGMAPVAIIAASLSLATGRISLPAGVTASSLPIPAGSRHWPAAPGPSLLPAAGRRTALAAVADTTFPAAGAVTDAASTTPSSTTDPIALAMLADPGWAEPGAMITLTAVLANHGTSAAPGVTISGTDSFSSVGRVVKAVDYGVDFDGDGQSNATLYAR